MIRIKRNLRLYLTVTIFSVFTALLTSMQIDGSLYEPISVYLIRSVCFSEVLDDITLIMTKAIVLYIQIVPLIDIFKKDFNIELWFCMPRYKSKMTWYVKKTATVFKMSALSCFVHIAVCVAVLWVKKIVDFNAVIENKTLLLEMLLTEFLYVLSFALLLNAFSIKFGAKSALPAGAVLSIFYSFSYVAELKLSADFSLVPLSRAFIFNHKDIVKLLPGDYSFCKFPEMSLFSTVLYFIILISAILIIEAVIIHKTDLGLIKEY